MRPKSQIKFVDYLFAVARELSSGWRGGGSQLKFASVVHDKKKPRVAPNLVFSSVLGPLFLPFDLSTDENETKI